MHFPNSPVCVDKLNSTDNDVAVTVRPALEPDWWAGSEVNVNILTKQINVYDLILTRNHCKMSVLRAIAVFLCGFIVTKSCSAQIALPGACPSIQAMTDFEPARYLGKWYEAEKYFFLFELGGKCITANYGLKDSGMISVVNKQISTFTGMQSQIVGEASQVSRSDEGKLSVRFPSLPVDIPAPYWVVDTDYDSYAVVWSCYEFGLFHTRNAWILTRERNPPPSVMKKAYEAVEKNKINRSFFMTTNQQDCPEDST